MNYHVALGPATTHGLPSSRLLRHPSGPTAQLRARDLTLSKLVAERIRTRDWRHSSAASAIRASALGKASKVLIVGAGATGACMAYRLRQLLGSGSRICLWEKARGPGGRMSTNRQDFPDGRLRADMGAQYISLNCSDSACSEVASLLTESDLFKDLSTNSLAETPERQSGPGWRHLAGVAGGVNDGLKKLLDEADAEVHFQKRVAKIDEDKDSWNVEPFKSASERFDAVALAVPGRGVGGDNLNKIRGTWQKRLTSRQNQQLREVTHDARWSVALFLSPDATNDCDAFFENNAVERLIDDDVLHLLCYQSRKTAMARESNTSCGCVVVAHTTNNWAQSRLKASGRDRRLVTEVTKRINDIIGFQTPLSKLLRASKVITWKQSQVMSPVLCQAGSKPCLVVSTAPPLLLAGDYFTESSFGGCLKSGFSAAEALAGHLS
eukprot:TRINITY_DN106458_c0_g1_i1.p1 TRINITY_DN106458_c0_g1~~TRINITY_DN106458_c0_g1_i1.p1  ORF type:complete len:438 (+),score=38.50 TRINITY_DN106458_c0_g1_i1:85-1398(+)